MDPQYKNREDWLTAAGRAILSNIILPVVTASNVVEDKGWVVSCGWPSKRATARTHRRTGECWPADSCADKTTHHIFITPALDDIVTSDGDGVLPTLVHELIHAVVGCKVGHRGVFRRVALAVGLEGKMTSTTAGPELISRLAAMAAMRLGPYPHGALSFVSAHKKDGTRLKKVICVNCGPGSG
jgi:hypothetical protein